jgi:DNA replication protein DnaC
VGKLPVKDMAKELMLTWISNNYEALFKEARDLRLTHEEFLADALDRELESRLANRIQRRIHEARFPLRKYRKRQILAVFCLVD